MEQRAIRSSRTGAAVLALVVASNFVPWLELLAGGMGDLATPAPMIGGIGSCLIAAGGVFAAWLIGRRRRAAAPARILRPRRAALQLAILAVSVNLGLAGTLLALGRDPRLSAVSQALVFCAIWYFGVLPAELAAAFFQGRASDRTPRPDVPGSATRPHSSPSLRSG